MDEVEPSEDPVMLMALRLPATQVMVPTPLIVTWVAFGVRFPLNMPATVWGEFMVTANVTVESGVPLGLLVDPPPTAKQAALLSTHATGAASPARPALV